MVAYIVGMITGAICLVFPLIYVMNFDRSVAKILSKNPDFPISTYAPHVPASLLHIVAIVGAVVLLLSAVMAALSGSMRLRDRRGKAQGATAPPPVPSPPEERLDLAQPDDL
ncbi:MAG: hypothetical protein ACYTFZ_03075 [Planctomycetota bacterium]|jgi:hypothetical protein